MSTYHSCKSVPFAEPQQPFEISSFFQTDPRNFVNSEFNTFPSSQKKDYDSPSGPAAIGFSENQSPW